MTISISIEGSGESLDYLCPIGQVFMRRPFKTPCGHIFEEVCILDWLRRDSHSSCPMDRRNVTKEQLVLQTSLQKEIQLYLQQHPEEDDSEDYQRLIEEHSLLSQNNAIQLEISQRENQRNYEPHHWRMTLRRTHRVALLLLTLSTTAWIFTTFFLR